MRIVDDGGVTAELFGDFFLNHGANVIIALRSGNEREEIHDDVKQQPGTALEATGIKSYSHPGSVAVRLELIKPWSRSLWQETAIPSGARGFVVVGAERAPGQLGCPCTLKLWEAQGPRTITLGNVTFLAVQQSPAHE
jgi:hypothetical protein